MHDARTEQLRLNQDHQYRMVVEAHRYRLALVYCILALLVLFLLSRGIITSDAAVQLLAHLGH
jgi:hypothetical protein